MKKPKSTKKVEPVQTKESNEHEISDLLKSIKVMARKAGCMLDASKDSLEVDEICLLEDVRALGVRAEHLMVLKMEAEGFNPDEVIISKSLSRTDIGYHLTLTSVEEKLKELQCLWGQHGQVLEVTDLTDNAKMDFTYVIWSHHKGRRALLTGAWKKFCRKHGFKVGGEISICVSNQSGDGYILSYGKSKNPLAVLKKKVLLLDEEADGRAGHASPPSTTLSGETSSPAIGQNEAVVNESGNSAAFECDDDNAPNVTEDEKIFDLADYLFKLSRWGSPLKNPRTS